MLGEKSKHYYGCQVTWSYWMGSIPYYWSFKTNRLVHTNSKLKYAQWLLTTWIMWAHELSLLLRFPLELMTYNRDRSGADIYFHIFYIFAMIMPTFMDLNTLIHKNDLVHFVNKNLHLDEKLTSKL